MDNHPDWKKVCLRIGGKRIQRICKIGKLRKIQSVALESIGSTVATSVIIGSMLPIKDGIGSIGNA